MAKEKGAAKIVIDLEDSVVRVYHGVSGALLFEQPVTSGYWKRLWKVIKTK